MEQQHDPLWEKVDRLERHDYDAYLRQIATFSKDEVRRIFTDWRLYRRAFIWVLEATSQGEFVPVRWHPRPWQAAYEGFPASEALKDIRRTSFDQILKSRKTGATTDVQTENYAKAATQANHKGWFLSYEEQVAKDVGDALRVAHDMNPYAPKLSSNNQSGMEFETTKSRIAIRTAGAKVLARGLNLNLIHMTEVSHLYKSVEDTPRFMAGVLDALARGGRCVLETTPNGEDPIFYANWVADNELWHHIFLPAFVDTMLDWTADDPRVLPSTANDEFELSEYEQSLVQAGQPWGAGRGHIRFLRWQKQKYNAISPRDPTATAVVGDEKILLQEYPIDDISCFLSSAETVFDQDLVRMHRNRAKPPLWTEQHGELRIWEHPQVGRPYVVFVDTSEGMPTSDWQAAAVLDPNKLKYVATLRCKRDWPDLANAVNDLAKRYNEALLMVERNNGGTTLLYILDTQLHYPNLYYHDESGFTERVLLGWKTDGITKPIMVSTFKEAFEAGAVEVNDIDALYEMAQYRFLPQVKARSQDKYQAPAGGHDDLVIAHMGAFQGRDLAHTVQNAPVIHYGGVNG